MVEGSRDHDALAEAAAAWSATSSAAALDAAYGDPGRTSDRSVSGSSSGRTTP